MSKKISTLLLILSIACFSFLALGSGTEDDSPSKEPGESAATGETADSSPASAAAQEKTFALKETAVFASIKVTANQVKRSAGSEYMKPASGKVFVGVEFTIENVSTEDQSISSILLFEAYADDSKCEYSFSAGMAFTEGTLDGSLSPGKKMTGYYAVEVSTDAKKLELEVKSSWLNASKATFAIDIPQS